MGARLIPVPRHLRSNQSACIVASLHVEVGTPARMSVMAATGLLHWPYLPHSAKVVPRQDRQWTGFSPLGRTCRGSWHKHGNST